MNVTRTFTTFGLLTAASIAMSPIAQAASFGTGGIIFDSDTTLTFSFESEIGKFGSTLGVYSADGSSLLKELFGEEVGAKNSFNFLAGVEYTLGLDSGSNGIVYSTSSLNEPSQQAVFFGCGEVFADESCELDFTGSETVELADFGDYTGDGDFLTALLAGEEVFISFDDRGNSNDVDFQDFTVSVNVPEPASVLGLMVMGAASALKLRRRNDA